MVESDWFSSPTCSCSNPPVPEHLLWCYLHLWPHHHTCQCRHTDHTVGPLKVPHTHCDCHTSGAGQEIARAVCLSTCLSMYLHRAGTFSEIQILWAGRPLPITHHSYHSSMSILSFPPLPPILQIQPTQQRAIRFPNIFQTFGRYREPDPFPV